MCIPSFFPAQLIEPVRFYTVFGCQPLYSIGRTKIAGYSGCLASSSRCLTSFPGRLTVIEGLFYAGAYCCLRILVDVVLGRVGGQVLGRQLRSFSWILCFYYSNQINFERHSKMAVDGLAGIRNIKGNFPFGNYYYYSFQHPFSEKSLDIL